LAVFKCVMPLISLIFSCPLQEDIDLLSTEYAEGCAVGYGKKSGGKKAGGKKAGGKKSGEGTTAGKKGGRRKRSLLCECGPEGEGPCPDDDAIEIIELDDLFDDFDDFVEPQGPMTGEDADIFEEPQGPLTGEDPVPNAVDDNDESISNEGTSLSVPWADDDDESISNEGVDILGQGEDDDNDDDDDESISNEGTSIGLDVETDVEDRDGLNGGFFLDLPPPIELDEGDEDYEVTNEDFKPPTNEDYAG